MSVVLIESPFWDPDPEVRQKNLRYLSFCIRAELGAGNAPIAAHALWPLAWGETETQRAAAIGPLREAVVSKVDRVHYYLDLGWSDGMRKAWDCDYIKRPADTRRLVTLPNALYGFFFASPTTATPSDASTRLEIV